MTEKPQHWDLTELVLIEELEEKLVPESTVAILD